MLQPAHSGPGAAIAGLLLVAAAALSCQRDARPDIFVLNVDMLRADHLGVHGYERDTTPVIDRLARDGVWFRRARSHASWTLPSVATLLSGLYPTTHGAGYRRDGDHYTTSVFPSALESLPERLREHGYATAAFVTNPLLKRASGLASGFDHFADDFVGAWRPGQKTSWWMETMSAEHVDAALLDWLDERGDAQPVFAYVHYIDVHGPYLEPRSWSEPRGPIDPKLAERARTTGRHPDVMRDVYDSVLRTLDRRIGELVAALERRGRLDRSIVVVTSDHGEEIDDHGGFGHGHTLYEELLHVPLLFLRTSALPYRRTIDEPVGQIDLFPTLVSLAGAVPPAGLPGVDLTPLITGAAEGISRAAPLFAELDNRERPAWNAPPGAPDVSYALFTPPFKYIVGRTQPLVPGSSAPDVSASLYDLDADPGEQNDLLQRAPLPGDVQKALDEVVGRARSLAIPAEHAPIDAGDEARLRTLGYVE